MGRAKPKVGDVIQIALPTGRFAYGRILRDASVAFYRSTTIEPGNPPIGSGDYQFVVAVYDDVLTSGKCPIVGRDPSTNDDDDWPPPYRVTDPISNTVSTYHKGIITPAAEAEARGLEPAAVWDFDDLVGRLADSSRGPARQGRRSMQ